VFLCGLVPWWPNLGGEFRCGFGVDFFFFLYIIINKSFSDEVE
jgi:hypothetical protein